jgi:hypothetical protein
MNRLVKYLLVSGFFLMIFMGKTERALAQDDDYKAYTLFLYNFMKYIEWPDPEGDFVIGVVGESPIKKELTTLSETKKAKGRKIVVKVISTPDDALGCSMVYIPSAKSSMLKLIYEKTKSKPILIVGEREGLAKKGAAISFVVDDDDALKFDLNKSFMESHSLKVANLLMQLAILVG